MAKANDSINPRIDIDTNQSDAVYSISSKYWLFVKRIYILRLPHKSIPSFSCHEEVGDLRGSLTSSWQIVLGWG